MNHSENHYPGDAITAADPAPYPTDWSAEQRVSMYWYAMKQNAHIRFTNQWETLAKQAKREQSNRQQLALVPNPDDETPPQ